MCKPYKLSNEEMRKVKAAMADNGERLLERGYAIVLGPCLQMRRRRDVSRPRLRVILDDPLLTELINNDKLTPEDAEEAANA